MSKDIMEWWMWMMHMVNMMVVVHGVSGILLVFHHVNITLDADGGA